MKLTNDDKKYLSKVGYEKSDFKQIEEAMNKTTYEIFLPDNQIIIGKPIKERISRKKVLELMDRTEWLSGISRSAFHLTASRMTKDNREILFDSKQIFK